MSARPETILSIELPFNENLAFYAFTFGAGDPEVAITSGFYGDEYNGLYVCHKLIGFLSEVTEGRAAGGRLKGRVKIFPALNPLGTMAHRRYWPFDQRDINLSFPGVSMGETTERIAAAVLASLRDCRSCIDLCCGSRFFEELPHIRLYESIAMPDESALSFNLPIVWRRHSTPLLTGSLAHNLNLRGVPTFVLKFGGTDRIDPLFCERVYEGILNYFVASGVLEKRAGTGPAAPAAESPWPLPGRIIWPKDVLSVLSPAA